MDITADEWIGALILCDNLTIKVDTIEQTPSKSNWCSFNQLNSVFKLPTYSSQMFSSTVVSCEKQFAN